MSDLYISFFEENDRRCYAKDREQAILGLICEGKHGGYSPRPGYEFTVIYDMEIDEEYSKTIDLTGEVDIMCERMNAELGEDSLDEQTERDALMEARI